MTNTSGAQSSTASSATPPPVSAESAASGSSAAGGGGGGEDRLAKAVRAAEQALIEFEIAVETFRVEVENFSRLHHQRLGPMYARLDELDALIAEAVAAHSGDREDIERAWEARALVMPMPGVEELFGGLLGADGVRPVEDPNPPRRVRPGREAQRLFRELARKAHPDLAQDEAEKDRRSAFIARVNEAYAYADEDALRALSQEWDAGPVPEEALPSEAEVLYARLEWLAERKEKLAALAVELDQSAIGQMMKLAPDDPDALLNEIAEQLLTQVAQREARLAELVRKPPGRAERRRAAAAAAAAGSSDSSDVTPDASSPEPQTSTSGPSGPTGADATAAATAAPGGEEPEAPAADTPEPAGPAPDGPEPQRAGAAGSDRRDAESEGTEPGDAEA